MATIKAYTDLDQSKKLAEILPLESGDTIWDLTNPDLPTIRAIPYEDSDYNNKYLNIIPCWSLASLLELLPKRIEIVDNVYELSVYLYGIYYWNVNNGNLFFESRDKDNLVDACVDTIIRLNELNLL